MWCYNSFYLPTIEVDCKDLSPNMPIKIGDVEMRLPPGMFLHKDWERKRQLAVVKLTETNSYI